MEGPLPSLSGGNGFFFGDIGKGGEVSKGPIKVSKEGYKEPVQMFVTCFSQLTFLMSPPGPRQYYGGQPLSRRGIYYPPVLP